ncbi:hypothetical protein CHLRE_12g542627v5 [Chlamydomonas reinhardtii]|uniref:Uncharacterized protein n=1 Tax=Chlamydomonas reinhardtii TaxID=3055 RepID=A0A2K3D708_CHLRE|nr:uncharacterized protein CHLRE_12g542627v5 [Chlamydomonas reinhardtii]PNW76318.1 hypothetical protein CHLRE_12g542627v5 [Chlamydomonas reinhardtii]
MPTNQRSDLGGGEFVPTVASADYALARRERASLLLLQQRGGGTSGGDAAALVEAAGLELATGGTAGALDMGAMDGPHSGGHGQQCCRQFGQGTRPRRRPGRQPLWAAASRARGGQAGARDGASMAYAYQGFGGQRAAAAGRRRAASATAAAAAAAAGSSRETHSPTRMRTPTATATSNNM